MGNTPPVPETALADVWIQENSLEPPLGYVQMHKDLNAGFGGNDQNVSVKYDTITDPNQLIVTRVFQAPVNTCPPEAPPAKGARYWGMGNKCKKSFHTCVEKKKVKDVNQIIKNALGEDTKNISSCPSGYYVGSEFSTSCSGNLWRKLCIKEPEPYDFYKDTYCKGINLEKQDCRTRFDWNDIIYKRAAIDYCTKDAFAKENGFCKYLAKQEDIEASGQFETPVKEFCSTHPNDPFCACSPFVLSKYDFSKISNPIVQATFKAQPKCFNDSCATGSGYRFQNLIAGWNADCPSMQVCDVHISNIVGSEIKNVQCKQDIINDITASAPALPPVQFNNTVSPSDQRIPDQRLPPLPGNTITSTNTSGVSNEILGAGAILFLLFVCVILYLLLSGGDDDIKQPSYYQGPQGMMPNQMMQNQMYSNRTYRSPYVSY